MSDGWTEIIRNLGVIARMKAEKDGAANPDELVQLADFKKMESIRARVDEKVSDPAVAAALKPWYNQFCKRPCFHDEYLDTFNRPNVSLIDTDGKGVERITRDGVIAGGKEYKLDCLVFATGFEVGTSYARRAGYEVHGRGGRTLEQKWEQGARTLHGMTVNGFPNCFIFSIIQSGFTANYPHSLDEQASHTAHIIAEAMGRQATRVEPTEQAEQGWTREVLESLMDRRQFLEECTPGYYNGEGQLSPAAASFASYGKGSPAFFRILDEWRQAGDFAGLEMD